MDLLSDTKNHVFGQWSTLRKQILGLLYRLLQISPFDDETELFADPDLIQEFCKSMHQYVTIGDLNIFNMVQELTSSPLSKKLHNLFINLLQTTDQIIDYNDKYLFIDAATIETAEKVQDLSYISEAFAARMEIEDELLSAMPIFK